MAYEDTRRRDRYGDNNPLSIQRVFWDGYRSIRIDDGNIGLATTAYSYALSYGELEAAAERISLLWNLHLNDSTDDLRAAALSDKGDAS